MPTDAKLRRLQITVRGVVQGVGFRPFVYNAACQESLRGSVCNDVDGVKIDVAGGPAAIDRFLETLRLHHPPQAVVDSIETHEIPRGSISSDFEILPGDAASAPRPVIPADLATCSQCCEEIRDSRQRRVGYAFTNCTNCGPRWSIIAQLPYDRPRTSMRDFVMCAQCRTEYENPRDRRFHAQPIACPQCGPKLRFLETQFGADGKESKANTEAEHNAIPTCLAEDDEAIRSAIRAVTEGKILAVKGLGGFQLIADATNPSAVALLRQRKHRPHKPFAVMLLDVDDTRKRCHVTSDEANELASHRAPILLVRKRTDANALDDIAAEVSPDNPTLGVMLPYTPLHQLLMEGVNRPIVCTSGNLSEEPMAIHTDQASRTLGSIADFILSHDRPIVRPVDDSVGRFGAAGFQILRRARGFAPLPIRLRDGGQTVLAVGGHLKNAVAVALDQHVIVGSHVGDLDNSSSVAVHRQAIDDLVDFFQIKPDLVACDRHPDYASTRHAEQLAKRWDVPLVRVQHHHAHVASCMAENDLTVPVLGFAWDGTGYGDDGTVWGSEALLCDPHGYDRIAHLRAFPLPGGDCAARQPRFSALGAMFEAFGADAESHAKRWFSSAELAPMIAALQRGNIFPRTSGLGRLFDAVAAICGLADSVSFEGQAAMALEFAATDETTDAYPLPVTDGNPAIGDWRPMLREVLSDSNCGVEVGTIAARFHNSLADFAVAIARRAQCPQVALTGGCFQNERLCNSVRQRLLSAGFQVFTHRQVPPGDGGLALGQVTVARSNNLLTSV